MRDTDAAKLPWHTPTCPELIIAEIWKPVIGYERLYEVSNYVAD